MFNYMTVSSKERQYGLVTSSKDKEHIIHLRNSHPKFPPSSAPRKKCCSKQSRCALLANLSLVFETGSWIGSKDQTSGIESNFLIS